VRERRPESCPSLAGDLLVLAIPALLFVQFSFGGSLFASDLISLGALPFLLLSREAPRIRHPFARRFVQLSSLWLFGQVLTDLIRGTPSTLLLKGWSLILFTTVHFAVMWLLVHTTRRLWLALWGTVLGLLLNYWVTPSAYAVGDPWKFGYGAALTLAVVLLANAISLPAAGCMFVLLGLGMVNVLQGFRSAGGVCLVAGAFVFLQWFRVSDRIRPITPARAVGVLVTLSVAATALLSGYSALASRGVLGEREQTKYAAQTGQLGPLVGGRPDAVFAVVAIGQSPFLGHGSWAQRTAATDGPAIRFLNRERYTYRYPVITQESRNVIPTHSHLLGAWVVAGILGVPFWVWLLTICFRSLAAGSATPARTALIALLGAQLVWDCLFSPFGADRRLTVPVLLISISLLCRWQIGKPLEDVSVNHRYRNHLLQPGPLPRTGAAIGTGLRGRC
jgi:hypothetical protein